MSSIEFLDFDKFGSSSRSFARDEGFSASGQTTMTTASFCVTGLCGTIASS